MSRLIAWFLDFIVRLFCRKSPKYRPPSDLLAFQVKVDAMNVRFNIVWTEPGPRQRPLSHARIETRVSTDLPWTAIGVISYPNTDLLEQDVPPGTHFYRAVVVDDADVESLNPLQASIEIPFDPPSDLAEFTVTLE